MSDFPEYVGLELTPDGQAWFDKPEVDDPPPNNGIQLTDDGRAFFDLPPIAESRSLVDERAQTDELFQQAITLPSPVSARRRYAQLEREESLEPTRSLPPIGFKDAVIDDINAFGKSLATSSAGTVFGVAEVATAMLNSIPLIHHLVPDDLDAYDWSAYLEALTELHAPGDLRMRGSMQRMVSEGLAGTIPLVASSLVGGTIPMVLAAAGAGAHEQSRRAEQSGATSDERRYSTILGAFVGLADIALPVALQGKFVSKILMPLDKFAKGALTKTIIAEGGELTIDGAIEFVQEMSSNTMHNVIAKNIYDENQDIFEGWKESGQTGGIVGVILGAIFKGAKFGALRADYRSRKEAGQKDPIPNLKAFEDAGMPDLTRKERGEFIADLENDAVRPKDGLTAFPATPQEAAETSRILDEIIAGDIRNAKKAKAEAETETQAEATEAILSDIDAFTAGEETEVVPDESDTEAKPPAPTVSPTPVVEEVVDSTPDDELTEAQARALLAEAKEVAAENRKRIRNAKAKVARATKSLRTAEDNARRYAKEHGYGKTKDTTLADADADYQKLVAKEQAAREKESTASGVLTRAENDAKPSTIEKDATELPIDALPGAVSDIIKGEAQGQLDELNASDRSKIKSKKTREALLKIIRDEDVGAEVKKQKQRLIDHLMSRKDFRTVAERDMGVPERGANEVIEAYLSGASDAEVDAIAERTGYARPSSALSEAAAKARQEAKDAMDDLIAFEGGGIPFANKPLDPEWLRLSNILIGKFVKTKVYDFAEFMSYVVERYGQKVAEEMRPVWRNLWIKAQADHPEMKDPDDEAPAGPTGESLFPTGIKDAITERDAGILGISPPVKELRLKWPEAVAAAERKIAENPRIARTIIEDMLETRRNFVDETETMIVALEKVKRVHAENVAIRELARADDAGDALAASQAETNATTASADLAEVLEVAYSSGSVAGGTFNIRQLLIGDDYTISKLAYKKRVALGRKLTKAEMETVEEHFREIKKQDLIRKKKEAVEGKEKAEEIVDEELARNKKKTAGKRKKKAAKADKDLEDAKKAFAKVLLGKLSATPGLPVDPEFYRAAFNLAKAYINKGVASFQAFYDKIKADFGKDTALKIRTTLEDVWSKARVDAGAPVPESSPETADEIHKLAKMYVRFFVETGLTDRDAVVAAVHEELMKYQDNITLRDTMDAIAGVGRYVPATEDEIEIRIQTIAGEVQQLVKIAEMEAGNAPPLFGQGRIQKGDVWRRLIQKSMQMLRKGGFRVVDPIAQAKSALDAIKTRLKNQIADLTNQIENLERTVKDRNVVELDAEAIELKAERDQLKTLLDQLVPRKGMSDAQLLKIAAAGLDRQISELERRIQEGDVSPLTKKSKTAGRQELESRRKRRDELSAEFKKLREEINPEAAYKAQLRARLKYWKKRRADKDYAPRVRKERKFDKELTALLYKVALEKLKFQREMKKDLDARRTQWQKVWGVFPESANLSRALITSIDYSAALRQGGFYVYAHPIKSRHALSAMFKAGWSKEGSFQVSERLKARENYWMYLKYKVALTDHDGALSEREEVYMSEWSKVIPLLPVAGSERAYVAFLNEARADLFDSMIRTVARGGEITEAEGKLIASFVNAATGRGSNKELNKTAKMLSAAFFSPRYVWSRVQLLMTGVHAASPFPMGSKRFKRAVRAEYARMFTGMGVFYAAMGAALTAFLDDDEWAIETDPRSSDFMKIRIGNTRLDPLFGMQQIIVLVTREVMGERKTLRSGKIKPIRNAWTLGGGEVKYREDTGFDILTRFARTKAAPVPGFFLNVLAGETVVGEKVTAWTSVRDLAMPMSISDVAETMAEQGLPLGTSLSLLQILGMGLQTFDVDKKR